MSIPAKFKKFTIDINSIAPLSWSFLRGDKIEMEFEFKKGSEDFDITGASKLRVFCYTTKGEYAFGDEFDLANSKAVATFTSARTSRFAGATILTAQLIDTDNNLINSANINVLIIESNSQEPFEPSPVFRDEVLEAKDKVLDAEQKVIGYSLSAYESEQRAYNYSRTAEESANSILGTLEQVEKINSEVQLAKAETIEAKNRAVEIADPNGVITSVQKDNVELKLDKANRGELWFDVGGTFATQSFVQNFPFSIAFTFEFPSGIGTSNYEPTIFNIGGVSGYNQTTGFVLRSSYVSSKNLTIYTRFNAGDTAVEKTIDASFFDGKRHLCVFVANADNYKFYRDGNLIYTGTWASNSFATAKAITFGASSNKGSKFSRIKVFNFDMSEENAPYTIADYQTGKDEPPSLHDINSEKRALLSLQDYTLTNGTTKQILDASGNANDATITGNVQGTNDVAVGRLVDFIVAQAQR